MYHKRIESEKGGKIDEKKDKKGQKQVKMAF